MYRHINDNNNEYSNPVTNSEDKSNFEVKMFTQYLTLPGEL